MPKGKRKNNKRPPSQFVNMTAHMKNNVKHAKIQIRETKNTLPDTIVTTLQPTTSEVTIDTSQSKALEELKQILKKKEEEIQRLKMSKRVKRQRKKRIFTQKDWQVRNVTKQRIFRKVKFITSKEQLDEFEEKNSVGYYFIKCYTEHMNDANIIKDKQVFWESVKHTVYDAINEKRNAVQTALKKKWIGTYYIAINLICRSILTLKKHFYCTNFCVEMYTRSKRDISFQKIFTKDFVCGLQECNKDHLFTFMDYFGQAIVGHKFFSNQMKCQTIFSDVATVSDEAYAKFTLERCWESWLSGVLQEKNPEIMTVKANHTNDKSNKKFGGWDEEGLKRFSAIAAIVNAQRKLVERKGYEKDYMQHNYNKMYKSDLDKIKEEEKATINEKVYTAYNDLGDNEASEIEDNKEVPNETNEEDHTVEDSFKSFQGNLSIHVLLLVKF